MSLADDWRAAKADENAARDRRLAIEERMLAVAGITPGSGRHTADGLTIHAGTTLRVDSSKAEQLLEELPEIRRFFRLKYEVDKRAWQHASMREQILMSDAVTEAAAKPSFSMKNEAK